MVKFEKKLEELKKAAAREEMRKVLGGFQKAHDEVLNKTSDCLRMFGEWLKRSDWIKKLVDERKVQACIDSVDAKLVELRKMIEIDWMSKAGNWLKDIDMTVNKEEALKNLHEDFADSLNEWFGQLTDFLVAELKKRMFDWTIEVSRGICNLVINRAKEFAINYVKQLLGNQSEAGAEEKKKNEKNQSEAGAEEKKKNEKKKTAKIIEAQTCHLEALFKALDVKTFFIIPIQEDVEVVFTEKPGAGAEDAKKAGAAAEDAKKAGSAAEDDAEKAG